MAYVSRTSGGLMAAVVSGLAIAPLARSSIPAGCRELTADDGYEVIDHSNVVLRVSKAGNGKDRIVEAMADAIRRAFAGD
ncbi:hypothetical protein D9M70_453430 [compost metagenome]